MKAITELIRYTAEQTRTICGEYCTRLACGCLKKNALDVLAMAREIRAEALREAADALEERTGPRTMPHEAPETQRLVEMLYTAIDGLRRRADAIERGES